jgi:hypothetical protein
MVVFFTVAPFILYYGFYGGLYMADIIAGSSPTPISHPENFYWFYTSKGLFGFAVFLWVFGELFAPKSSKREHLKT